MSLDIRPVVMVGIIMLVLALALLSTDALGDEENSKQPEDWEKRLEMLRSVPYLSYSEDSIDESDTCVVLHYPEKTCEGYNFYCTRASGQAFLLNMNGQVVHRWTYPPREANSRGEDYAVMLGNGDLLVLIKRTELLRINWDSELIWRRKLLVHHEVAPAPDGSLYTIILDNRDYKGMAVKFDAIVHLAANGREIGRWYIYDHLAELKGALDTRSFFDTVLHNVLIGRSGEKLEHLKEKLGNVDRYDYFHMNTISVLPATTLGERDSRFEAGNLLVCFRNVNQIAVLQKGTYRVLWAWGEGQLEWPHHPTMLENGHILIFDNGTQRKYSRVIELDPSAEAIVWEYTAEPPEDFYSFLRGSAQRLPNGNTLICESDNGRVFEVTEEGEIVWMWLNPSTQKGHREAIYRMLRLPSTQVNQLLTRQ